MSPAKAERVDHANQLIKAIAAHGRRFFYHKESGRVARMELDAHGRVWFVDEYSEARIYTHNTASGGRWRRFSHGGTLRSLVEQMRDYITQGKQLPRWIIAPERCRISDGDIWGYGEEAAVAVRAAAFAIPIMMPAPPIEDGQP